MDCSIKSVKDDRDFNQEIENLLKNSNETTTGAQTKSNSLTKEAISSNEIEIEDTCLTLNAQNNDVYYGFLSLNCTTISEFS